MSYRIVADELVIEVDNKKELRIALRVLKAYETAASLAPMPKTSLPRRIRRRLREIRKRNDAGQ